MQRINTTTKVVDKFGVGKHGFTNGNVVGGIPATDLTDSWFDNVQEEIANVVEAAAIALDGNTRNQLLTALRSAGVFTTAPVTENSTKMATTAFVRSLFPASLGTSGYMKFPGGLILQWVRNVVGTANGTGDATIGITYPIAFTTTVFGSAFYPVHESISNFGQRVVGTGPTLTSVAINIGAAPASGAVAISGIILGV